MLSLAFVLLFVLSELVADICWFMVCLFVAYCFCVVMFYLRLVFACLLCFAVMLFGFVCIADFGLVVKIVCMVCCRWGCFRSVCLLWFALFAVVFVLLVTYFLLAC